MFVQDMILLNTVVYWSVLAVYVQKKKRNSIYKFTDMSFEFEHGSTFA